MDSNSLKQTARLAAVETADDLYRDDPIGVFTHRAPMFEAAATYELSQIRRPCDWTNEALDRLLAELNLGESHA